MVIIQLEVPEDLAERLQQHQAHLADILERGLNELDEDIATSDDVDVERDEDARLEAALRAAGVRNPSVARRRRYMQSPEWQDWRPVPASGPPASDMIVTERKSRSWEAE